MKKSLLISSVLLFGLSSQAQWIRQYSGFAAVSRGVQYISAVDKNVCWGLAYDGSGANTNSIDFTRTIDGGKTWTAGTVNSDTNLAFCSISAINKDTAWVMMYHKSTGTGGGIWRTNDGGQSWNQQGAGTIFNSTSFPDIVHFWNENDGFAIGDPNNGTPKEFEIYTTTDGGQTWNPSDTADIPNPITGNPIEYAYTNVFSTVGDSLIWFGTGKGRIYKSSDRGITWAAYPTGLTNVTRVLFVDANNGLCHDGTTLKRSADGGQTWTTVNYAGTLFKFDMAHVPGGNRIVSTGVAFNVGDYGSSYSDDLGSTWVTLDTMIQHIGVAFADANTGWTGGFNDNSLSGMFRASFYDLAVAALNGPPSSCSLGNAEQITVTFINNGITSISNFDVSYSINGGTPVSEVVSTPITPAASAQYTFTQTADFSQKGTYDISIYISIPDDVSYNDTIHAQVINVYPGSASNPVVMGFEPTDTLAGWTVQNVNGDGAVWALFNNAQYAHNGTFCILKTADGTSTSDDDYLFTKCLDLATGTTYNLEYWYRTYDLVAQCNLEVGIGNNAINTAMIQIISSPPPLTDSILYYKVSENFTVSSSGTYYIGFHAYQSAIASFTDGLFIDDINIGQAVGINDVKKNPLPFSMYPNPSAGIINFEIKDDIKTSVEIYNLIGEMVYSFTEFTAGNNFIDLKQLGNGIYLVKVTRGGKVFTSKISLEK